MFTLGLINKNLYNYLGQQHRVFSRRRSLHGEGPWERTLCVRSSRAGHVRKEPWERQPTKVHRRNNKCTRPARDRILFGLLMVFVVGEVPKINEIKSYKNYYDLKMGKHEYCVKLIVACEKLRDKVETFISSDELGFGVDMEQEPIAVAENKYKDFGCMPEGLSSDGLKSFLSVVAGWEREVHKLFLHQNLFGVIEEDKRSRRMRVRFGRMNGWCPTFDEPEDNTTSPMTTSAEESEEETSTFNHELITTTKKNYVSTNVGNVTDFCKVSSMVGRWVQNEINGTLNIRDLTDRFPEFEKLLKKYRGHGCCPYKSVRDHADIINDGIDILEDLQNLKPSEKKDTTNVESDYRNLNSRLEHLKTGSANYSSGKCCPAFLDRWQSFQNNFQSNLKDFNPQKSNITLKGLLKNATTLEATFYHQQGQLKQSLQDLSNILNNTAKTCCGEQKQNMNLLENSLKDLKADKPHQNLSEKITAVRENLAKTNKILSDTKHLLGLEAKQIDKLQAECGKRSRIQRKRTIIDSLSSNVSKLVSKLDDMEFIRTVDFSKLNISVNIVSDMMRSDGSAFNNFKSVVRRFEAIELKNKARKNRKEKFNQVIKTVKETFSKVNLKISQGHVFHELYQENVTKLFKKYQKRQDDLKGSVKVINDSSKGPHNNSSILTEDINKLEKDLVYLTDIALPKVALDIIKLRRGAAAEAGEKLKNITWFHEKIKRKKNQILERINKLYQHKVKKPRTDPVKMETLVSQLSDRQAILAKRIAARHEVLGQHVREMKKRIAAASETALSCPLDCDLGDLPTVDSLVERVKVLEKKVREYVKTGKV